MIRVAIADDSPFTCKLLASYLEEGGDCQVVGVAHDAASTLDLIRTETPDVLTLDLQMPGGDGLSLLQHLSAEIPVSVVVISGVTRLAAATTLRALELGAVDFILKYTPGAPVSRASLKREIVGKVKLAAAVRATGRATAVAETPAAREITPRPGPSARARAVARSDAAGVVVIGASTGGPRAIIDVLSQLPPDFAVPCIVVQHLPAPFAAPFAAQLGRHARLRVQEAGSGDRLEAGLALVAPGSFHLVVRPDGGIDFRQPSQHDVYRPSVDLTMTSAADAFGSSAVGVVLTGMGSDGAEGLKRIREAGGDGFVQDPASCIVPSMPERAIERAGADYIARPERIGQMLAVRSKS